MADKPAHDCREKFLENLLFSTHRTNTFCDAIFNATGHLGPSNFLPSDLDTHKLPTTVISNISSRFEQICNPPFVVLALSGVSS